MMATLSKGMMTAATTSETIRLMVMVRGKRRRTSAASPFRVRSMGKKMAQMHTVARSMGQKYCCTLFMAASMRLMPPARYSRYPSMTTMLLSTIMPSTTMRHARVMMFSSMPMAYMIPVLTKVDRGMVRAATMALRMGKSTIITATMMTMEMSRSRRKSLTLVPTTSGWSVMRRICTSSGRQSWRNWSSISSTSSPNMTMLLPLSISSDRMTQRLPLDSI